MTQATAAERALLACLILSPELFPEARDAGFRPEMLTGAFRTICEAMESQTDAIGLQETLRAQQKLEEVGGPVAITNLIVDAPPPSSWSHYLPPVVNAFLARNAMEICHEAAGDAANSEDVDAVINRAISRLSALVDGRADDPDQMTLKDRVHDFINHIEELYERGTTTTGLLFGVPEFDDHTGGMQPGELWVVCGHTKSGKTALAQQAITTTATAGKWSSLFSLEMTGRQTVGRMVSSVGFVDGGFWRRPRLMSPLDHSRFTQGCTKVAEMPIRVYERKRSLSAICAAMRRDKRKHDIQLAVIDYGQLVDGERRGDENREREVARVSSTCKTMAVTLGIPVVLLSQTNDDGRLRESRAIGQDADAVIRVKAPAKKDEKGKPTGEPDLSSSVRKIEIEYARSFASASFDCRFINAQTRFEEA